MKKISVSAVCLFVASGILPLVASAQDAAAAKASAGAASVSREAVELPAGYVVGPEDVLSIVFWREKDMSTDVVVRPDGMVSLPLLRDVQAAGYTPEQLSGAVEKIATRYMTDPEVTVIVKEIRSRKVSVLGEVNGQGTVALTRDMNVLQLIAEAGGLTEHANKSEIVIVRQENGKERRFKFNYGDAIKGKNVEQNILLQPGDLVLVP